MATETVPMDDKELFSAATAAEPPAEAAPEPAAEAPSETGQPRDELGRFAKTEEAPQADAAPTQQQPDTVTTEQKPDEAQVPSWRLREVREAREAAERRAIEAEGHARAFQQRMAEMERRMVELQQPKPEPVDFFADPNAAFKQQVTPLQEQLSQLQAELRMETSRAIAVARHGWEAVAEMEKAVSEAMQSGDPSINALRGQLATSRDPVGTGMQWYSSQKVLKETGGDIGKFREKILADAMKDPAFQAKVLEAARGTAQQNTGDTPNIKLPPSINKTAGTGGGTASGLTADDMSDRALFRHAVNSR